MVEIMTKVFMTMNKNYNLINQEKYTMKNINAVAKICHQANKAYCEALGDDTQPEWEEAPEWQQQSAVAGVKYHMDNPDSKPEDSHNSWLKEKEEAGWKYGEVKDPEKKEHPCFVAYSDLSEEQQKKDSLFLGIVRALV